MKSWHSIFLAAFLAAGSAIAADNVFVDADTVRKAQQILTDRGFATSADGQMGPRTQAAIRKFQRAQNLEPTGQLNRQTLIALGLQEPEAGAAADEPRYSAQTIRTVQRTLNSRGFTAGTPDGTMNARTRKALSAFQRSENLEDSGRLNPATLAALGMKEEPSASAGATRAAPMPTATVREMQRRLNARGFDAGTPDGVWGDRTESALRDFQRATNLAVTGRPDRETLAALGMKESVAPQAARGR